MAAGPWTFTNAARQKIINRYIAGGSALSFKCALFQSTSNIGAASTTYAGVTNEVAAANGYTTGGVAISFSLSGTTSVPGVFAANPAWTASGGSIAARFAVIYEVSGDVLCWCLLDTTPADQVATAGNTFTVDSDGSPSPVFTLA